MTEGPRDPAVDLATYIETRLNLLNEAMKALNHDVESRLKEMDLRYEQRFEAQKEAILKSENATEKRLESMNEFRKTLGDQASTLMPRTESEQALEGLKEKINTLEKNFGLREGQLIGSRERMSDNRASIGIWITITAVIVSAAALMMRFYK